MIVEIGHLSLTVSTNGHQSNILESMGYDREFASGLVPNPPNKRSLMDGWSESHTLHLYRREGSVPIEIVKYPHTASGSSRYMLQSGPGEYFENPEYFGPSQYITDVGPMDTVAVTTPSPRVTRSFFQTLGFEEISPHQLEFRSPMSGSSIFLELVENGQSGGEPTLDRVGFSSLGLITTDILTELSRLEEAGYSVTSIETIDLPDAVMDVAFVTEPTGTPVELIGFHGV